jgi:hypothetical protein
MDYIYLISRGWSRNGKFDKHDIFAVFDMEEVVKYLTIALKEKKYKTTIEFLSSYSIYQVVHNPEKELFQHRISAKRMTSKKLLTYLNKYEPWITLSALLEL